MSGATIRGACPRLAIPMETGDGLLARLVPGGPITLDAFARLCVAAEAHGNGVMEVSARGSLQVRGLTPVSVPLFAASVEALDLDLCDWVPVLADPLPGDPSALIDAQALAADIRGTIAALGLTLAPKVSVIVDGGGQLHLNLLAADVRLRAVATASGPRLDVSLAGDTATAVPLGVIALDDAVQTVVALLTVVSSHGAQARARDVLRERGRDAFQSAVRGRLAPASRLPARAPAETIGLHRLKGGACAMGVALPFGQADAAALIGLASVARANGAMWIATAPSRTLLLGPICEMTGFALATAADQLGFIVDARDSRRRVVACPGSPACASGLIPARAIAVEIASMLPPSQGGVAVHVSGCAKGCAHPACAPLTLVGTAQGCGIVQGATARARPDVTVRLERLAAEAARLIVRETADA